MPIPPPMATNRQHGFTLVELLVALAVAAVLLGIGVPSFVSVVQDTRIGSQYNQVVRSFFMARSEAVKSGEFVVVCARSAPESKLCGDENDWKNGWIVYIDVDSTVAGAAQVGSGDTIISLEPAVSGDNTVRAIASLSSGGASTQVGHVRYLPRGNTNWQGGSVIVCDAARGAESSRAVNVRLTGNIQPARPNGTESVPRDAFDAPISCSSGGTP